ncbi:MAG: M28 family peptidase [Rhizobiales bacterium]|nr:M28 family peptidase [Hyphomicrobiales bacterium]
MTKYNISSPIFLIFLLVCMHFAFQYSFQAPQLIEKYDGQTRSFNGANAVKNLNDYLPNNLPHPVMSTNNAKLRQRIISNLKSYGYSPEIQVEMSCNFKRRHKQKHKKCVIIYNIVSKSPNAGMLPAMLMMAHYDSVPNSPGVGDDMAAVAALSEIMRQIKSLNFSNDIIFLFTDGEEYGLLGANAFAKNHPYFKHVGIVLNFEGRGNNGPSMLFETGNANAAMLTKYFKYSRTPHGSSLYDLIYQYMPNDTDFTVFRKLGLTGLNFAFSDAPNYYHSKNDTVEKMKNPAASSGVSEH